MRNGQTQATHPTNDDVAADTKIDPNAQCHAATKVADPRLPSRRLGYTAIALACATLLVGCAPQQPTELDLGRQSMQQRDFTGAESHLDTYLQQNPNGPRSAEAYYLKGHALQDAKSEDQNEAMGRLQQARLAYIDALKAGTDSRGLEGLIRASLADVAFWQEDYTTAAQQGTAAYPLLEDDNVRAMALYRAGLSQQRLGKFEDGDRTLGMVVKYHPNTPVAERAKQRIGVRAFNVKIPFPSVTAANSAVATLTRQGFTPTQPATDGSISIGPFSTYAQATAARTRINSQYPKATVVP